MAPRRLPSASIPVLLPVEADSCDRLCSVTPRSYCCSPWLRGRSRTSTCTSGRPPPHGGSLRTVLRFHAGLPPGPGAGRCRLHRHRSRLQRPDHRRPGERHLSPEARHDAEDADHGARSRCHGQLQRDQDDRARRHGEDRADALPPPASGLAAERARQRLRRVPPLVPGHRGRLSPVALLYRDALEHPRRDDDHDDDSRPDLPAGRVRRSRRRARTTPASGAPARTLRRPASKQSAAA